MLIWFCFKALLICMPFAEKQDGVLRLNKQLHKII